MGIIVMIVTALAPVLLIATSHTWLTITATLFWIGQAGTWWQMRSLAREADRYYDDQTPLSSLDELVGWTHDRGRDAARDSAIPNALALLNLVCTVACIVTLLLAILWLVQ